MSKLKAFVRIFMLSFFVLLASCVRDVDVDQAREIVIPPTVAIDLVYFTIDPSHFHTVGSTGIMRARDEVRLEFLDDDYIQDGLVRADFNFRYTNTFSQSFRNKITFLSESNRAMHVIKFEIPAGNPDDANIINYTEIIPEEDIEAIRRSIKMVIEIETEPNFEVTEGELQLKSRAFLEFEFK